MLPDPIFSSYPLADYAHYRIPVRQAAHRVLESGHYVLGWEVERFETEFAAFLGVGHAIGVASGTDAIELLLRACRIGRGNQVIVPAHTAVATVAAVVGAGAEPVFADVDPLHFTLSPESVETAIAIADPEKLKAVMAVHLYGQPADIPNLVRVCQGAGLRLFEDCAQATGASLAGRKVGSLADGAAFSFYPTKNLGALGDGGAVATRDGALAEAVRELRQYGWRGPERISVRPGGSNSRLDELQAAILRVKLAGLPEQIGWRQHLAARYRRGMVRFPEIRVPTIVPNGHHGFHLYVVLAEKRDALMAFLRSEGVPASIHYPVPIHRQPAFAGRLATPLEVTEQLAARILTLPLHGHLREEAVDRTLRAIERFAAGRTFVGHHDV